MPARRPSSSASSLPSPTSTKPLGPLDIPQEPEADEEEIKVNNANLGELKNALDDLLKKYLSRPGLFTQNHAHTDIKLALGYISVIIALVTGLYSYKTPFAESKPLTAIGVGLYFLLSTSSSLYSWAIEKEVVFVGKRRNFAAGRIETDRVKIETRSKLKEHGLASLPGRLAWALNPQSAPKASTGPGAKKASSEGEPKYAITFTYTLTASSGRSLLAKKSDTSEIPYSKFFDDNGVLSQKAFTSWVGGVVQDAITSDEVASK